MRKISFWLVCSFFLIQCDSEDQANNQPSPSTAPEQSLIETNETPTYTAEAFEKGPSDWGYRILNGEDLFINQPHIPAMQGNKGFSSEENALTAAVFIIFKLESGFVPPTVTREELDSLGVLN